MENASHFHTPTGNQVKQARAALGLSQRQLAKLAGVALSTVVAYERGQRPPYDSTIAKLRQTLEAAGVRFVEGGVIMSANG